MNFDQLTDADIQEYSASAFLIKEGEAKYLVTDAKPHVGKESGKPSIKLLCECTDTSGKMVKLYHYLTIGPSLIKFLVIHGFEQEIKDRKISESKLIGLKGRCQIKNEKNRDGEMASAIHYFKGNKKSDEVKTSESENDFTDDDVPF